jgi:hypothetical protein
VIEADAVQAAKAKESLERMRSQKETVIEEDFQHGISTHGDALAAARTALTKHDSDVKAEVANLVGENSTGASVNNSNAVHSCAALLVPEYIDLLLEFVPEDHRRAALNKFSTRGITPLMAVASTKHSPGSLQQRVEMVEKLIGLGADTSISDVFGETALGKFRAMKQAMADARLRFGYHSPQPHQEDLEAGHDVRLEQLLRPVGGPSAADESYLDDSDDDSDFRWDEED